MAKNVFLQPKRRPSWIFYIFGRGTLDFKFFQFFFCGYGVSTHQVIKLRCDECVLKWSPSIAYL